MEHVDLERMQLTVAPVRSIQEVTEAHHQFGAPGVGSETVKSLLLLSESAPFGLRAIDFAGVESPGAGAAAPSMSAFVALP